LKIVFFRTWMIIWYIRVIIVMVYQTGGNLKLATDFMHLRVKNIKNIVKFLSYFDSGRSWFRRRRKSNNYFFVKMTIEILKQSKVPNLDFTFFAVQEIWCFGIFFLTFFQYLTPSSPYILIIVCFSKFVGFFTSPK